MIMEAKKYPKHIGAFSFSKKRQRYEKSNCFFDPNKEVAYSYGHWKFVARIGGKIVFNNFSYSRSTSGHQGYVLHLMRQLGYDTDSFLFIDCPSGFGKPYSAISHYKENIELLQKKIDAPRSRKSTNAERLLAIEARTKHIEYFQRLLDSDHIDTLINEILEDDSDHSASE